LGEIENMDPISVNRFTARSPNRELTLRFYPDQVLREVAKDVHTYDTALQWLADQMFAFMKTYIGIGLAAPHVGVLYRIVVADVEGVERCLVNPELLSFIEENDTDTEGCLSIPERLFDVGRSLKIEIRARSPQRKGLHFEAEGLAARVLQHEIDHLNGILICDKGIEIENSHS
jgi:peptide deformylase